MNLTRDRVRSIGWAFVLTICAALTLALMLRVNAVKGQVHETERQIVAAKRDIQFLETEFQARANQHHLDALNEVEFGYVAPTASQYIEGERHLARLGMPRPEGAPSPIRMAAARRGARDDDSPLIAMVSPMRGLVGSSEPAARDEPEERGDAPVGGDLIAQAIGGDDIASRLTRIDVAHGDEE